VDAHAAPTDAPAEASAPDASPDAPLDAAADAGADGPAPDTAPDRAKDPVPDRPAIEALPPDPTFVVAPAGEPFPLLRASLAIVVFQRASDGQLWRFEQQGAGGDFAAPVPLGIETRGHPTAVVGADGLVRLFAAAADGTAGMWKEDAGGAWADAWPGSLPRVVIRDGVIPLVLPNSQLSLFAVDADRKLVRFHQAGADAEWTVDRALGVPPQEELGGDPAVVAVPRGSDSIEAVFVRTANGGVYVNAQTTPGSPQAHWVPWVNGYTGRVSAVWLALGGGAIQPAFIGIYQQNSLYLESRDPVSVENVIASGPPGDPFAVRLAGDRLAVFYRGAIGDAQLVLQTAADPRAPFAAPVSLAGSLVDGPAPVVTSDGLVSLFGEGMDGKVYWKRQLGATSWANWKTLP